MVLLVFVKRGQLINHPAVEGGSLSRPHLLLPCRRRLNGVSLRDREAEAGGCRVSHDGTCTVSEKVTLIIHEQPCKLVSIPAGKSRCEAADWCRWRQIKSR